MLRVFLIRKGAAFAMFGIILIAGFLVAGTVIIHAVGLTLILSHLAKYDAQRPARLWPMTWPLIKVAWLLLIIHGIEISLWAFFYLWEGCLPDGESAFYFSGVTYMTIGYGDVVLSKPWRILAPVEGATGILMCGLSTGLFFAVVTRIYSSAQAKARRR